VGFVWFLLYPVDRLVGTGELAHTAELSPVEIPEPAVGAALGPVQLGNGDPLAVELFALIEDLIGADFRTEITPFAPVLVDGEFHGSEVLFVNTYTVTVTKNLFFMLRVISSEDRLKPPFSSSRF
jgi:hypothetical protein